MSAKSVLAGEVFACLWVFAGVSAQSPGVLYTWDADGNVVNWFKNFGTNDVALAAAGGALTITEQGDPGTGVAVSDGFNTISEANARFDAGGIDLTGLSALEFDMGHNGSAGVDVQFFVQASPASTYVALGADQAIASGLSTYTVPLSPLAAAQQAYVRTIGINIRPHVDQGNLVWTLEEVRAAGTPLSVRDFATHNPSSSDSGLQGAIVNFDNGAIDGNDGGQNQTGLRHNTGGSPDGNSGSLRWRDLAGGGGGAVSYANGTVFQGNTFNERPTDLSNYNFVTVRVAATNLGGNVEAVGVQYFLQTGNFSFHAAGHETLPADGQFHDLVFPLAGIPDLAVVMQHGVNLDDHPGGDLLIDIDNVRASRGAPPAIPAPAFTSAGIALLALLGLAGGALLLRRRLLGAGLPRSA